MGVLEFLERFWPLFSGLVVLVLMVLAAGHAILYKRDSRAAVAWVGLILLSPFFGALFYFLFGINRIRRLAIGLTGGGSTSVDVELEPELMPESAPHMDGLARLSGKVTGLPLTTGNRIEPLINGDEAYPEMLKDIREAEETVMFSTYIFDNDEVGKEFAEEFAAAVRRGVEVRVLIDDFGLHYSFPTVVGRLRRAGVPVGRFMPVFLKGKAAFINLRTHRKFLCTDGKKAFIGGMNIRDGHWLSRNPSHPVKDLHFAIEGPVVAQLRKVFATDWYFTTKERLEGDLWHPELSEAGEDLARAVPDGPDEDIDKIRWLFIGALATAQKSVKVVTPYFLPDAGLSTALNSAALRGVTVDIFLPEKGNLPLVDWATQAVLWQNVKEGCRVWKASGVFDHTKVMVVDDTWVCFGSCNWDPRSLRLNFELNMEAFSPSLAARINSMIEEKREHSRLVSLDELDGRALPVKLRDGIARLLSPYL